jgi:aspartokinase
LRKQSTGASLVGRNRSEICLPSLIVLFLNAEPLNTEHSPANPEYGAAGTEHFVGPFMEKTAIGGIMQSDGRALVKIMSVPDHASVAGTVLEAMAAKGINIELLVESFDLDDYGNFALVIDQKDLDQALEALEGIRPTIDAKVVSYTPDVAVLTVFGHHLREKPHVHGLMFSSMASVGISSLAISTSISSVSCVVPGQDLATAVQALSRAFAVPFQVKERPKDY